MKYKNIPKTELNVSTLALGTWVFGGDMWSGSLERDSLDAVTAAMDMGVNLIDTAPVYGNGRSEEIVGKAIKGKRDKVILASKCGLVSNGKRIQLTLAPESIRKEIEDSLRRLQVEYIDLYQCHWPDPKVPIEKTLVALKQIQSSGKIRYIGLSNYDQKGLASAVQYADIVTLQSPYSILDRKIEKSEIPFCREHQIDILAYGPMGGGILTGKYSAQPQFSPSDARTFFYKYYQGQNFVQSQNILEALKKINRPLNQVAINWVRQQDIVASVLVGCRNAEQVRSNMSSVNWDLNKGELEFIKRLGVTSEGSLKD